MISRGRAQSGVSRNVIRQILSPAEVTRYARQIALEGWGRKAQERLKSSRVLIAGAGGLASSTALHLLAAGVGYLRLVDRSRVSLADLNQQTLYRECDLGKAKVAIAERRLKELNPFAQVEGQAKILTEHNACRLAAGCHLLIDATNHPVTGYFLNQAALKSRLPLLHAWVWGLDGYLTTFWPGSGPCLACAFPEASQGNRHSGGSQAALLGPLPGILGALQALEALRLLGGLAPALLGRLLIFKGEGFQFTEKPVTVNPQCLVCRNLQPL
jgi:molybdopterin/thiamine biosynthesis adenylyltransferase